VYWIQQIKLKSVWQPYVNFTAATIVQSKIITISQSPLSDRRQRMQHAAFPFCSFHVGDLITLFELSHPRSIYAARPQPDNHSLINHSRSGVNLIFNPGTGCDQLRKHARRRTISRRWGFFTAPDSRFCAGAFSPQSHIRWWEKSWMLSRKRYFSVTRLYLLLTLEFSVIQ
jgi:hypothetical protein